MSKETFAKIVHVWSQAIPDLQPHQDVLTKFIYLIEKIDGLPDMERRFHREGLSFYHAISKNRNITDLVKILKVFFEEASLPAVAAPEEQASHGVSAERLGGVQGEQVLFVKKIGEAEFYGALWPWKDREDVVTVHLGVCSPDMTEDDHEFMYSAMKGHLTESTTEKIDINVRGLIQGVSLSSFLQMSEMEGSTCTLEVKAGNKTGTLHLLNGSLIDAETGSLKHKAAVFAILGWENTEIYIQKPSGRQKNEINLPLMHILIEALKKKDKVDYENDAFVNKLNGRIEQATDDLFQKEPDAQTESARPGAHGDEEKGAQRTGETGPDIATEAGEQIFIGRKPPGTGDKKKRTFLIVIASAAVLFMGIVVFWIFIGGNGGMAKRDYEALMVRLESTVDDAAKEKLLNAFIDTHTDDPVYTDKAMQALFDVLSQMETSDYEKAVAAVFKLPLDRHYHQKAEEIFNAFLERHPESRFHDDVTKRLVEIYELTDDAHFSELSNLDPRDYLGKMQAFNEYIRAYPDGRHRQEVEQLARETLQASYREFSDEIQKCRRKKRWDDCLATCRQYRESFRRYMGMSAVDKLEAELLERRALDRLKAETEGADDETVRKLYLAFLKSYPESSEKSRLEQRIAEIDRKRSTVEEWVRVKAVGQDTTKTLSYRIAVVRRYIDQNAKGPYLIEAENLLWNLEQQAGAGSRTRTGTGTTQSAATGTAEKDKTAFTGQDNAARLESLKQKVAADLAKTRGRYVLTKDGTVRDKATGLEWTMLDSFDVMGGCVDYRQAVAYVAKLQDGGHNDWRMPTSAELAGIYQNSPYYPSGGAEWYWSSEVYEKGYQTIANIVNAEPEAVYRKRSANVRKCGAVRAVRP